MITLDDKYRLEDFGIRGYQDHEHPATPEYDNKTMAIPGMPGRWDFGTELRSRPFNLYFKTVANDRNELQMKMNDFIAFLHDEFGVPRLIKVSFDYEPDKHYFMKVNEPITPERLARANKFPVRFIAHDPLKYANVETQEINWDSTTATYDDSWSMDTVFVDDVVITTPQTVEAYVNGLAISPTILISGSGNNVTFQLNGKSFSLKNFTNSTFEIRGKDFTVFKNGIDTFTEMTGKHLTLLPGLNQIQISGSNMNFNLSVEVRDQYL